MNKSLARRLRKYSTMYLFLIPAVLVTLVFSYVPMAGTVMAFQKYDIFKGIAGSPFVGLTNFREFLSDANFYRALWNTLRLNGLHLLIAFPLPIAFAIAIFAVRDGVFKRVTQTISYLPHFVSWIVVAGIVYKLLDKDSGIINVILGWLGQKPIAFMRDPNHFTGALLASAIWKELGWNTIIFLAALASIETEQYEAAVIDGANSFDKLRFITLPGLAPTISLMLIFNVGSIAAGNGPTSFDAIYNMRNALVARMADTLDYYVFAKGIISTQYGLSTAVGIAQGLVSLGLVMSANVVSKRIRGYGAF
jgi:putative aldouronate transport system permease protein